MQFIIVDDDSRFFLNLREAFLKAGEGFSEDREPPLSTQILLKGPHGETIAFVDGFDDAVEVITRAENLAGIFLDGDLGDDRSPPAGWGLFDVARQKPGNHYIMSCSSGQTLYEYMCKHGFTANTRGGHTGKSIFLIISTVIGIRDLILAQGATSPGNDTAVPPTP